MLVRWTSSRWADWETSGSDDTHTMCSHTSDRVLHYRGKKKRGQVSSSTQSFYNKQVPQWWFIKKTELTIRQKYEHPLPHIYQNDDSRCNKSFLFPFTNNVPAFSLLNQMFWFHFYSGKTYLKYRSLIWPFVQWSRVCCFRYLFKSKSCSFRM